MVRLNLPKHSKPEFSLLSWSAMLFSAGIGIDLMFFSVAEPLSHYMQPPVGVYQTYEAARQSMVWTLFHYGLTGWCMYALIGILLVISVIATTCRLPFVLHFTQFLGIGLMYYLL